MSLSAGQKEELLIRDSLQDIGYGYICKCGLNFDDLGEYKVTINVYYYSSDLELQDSEQKIDWLLNNGERATPWQHKVYVGQEDVQ